MKLLKAPKLSRYAISFTQHLFKLLNAMMMFGDNLININYINAINRIFFWRIIKVSTYYLPPIHTDRQVNLTTTSSMLTTASMNVSIFTYKDTFIRPNLYYFLMTT